MAIKGLYSGLNGFSETMSGPNRFKCALRNKRAAFTHTNGRSLDQRLECQLRFLLARNAQIPGRPCTCTIGLNTMAQLACDAFYDRGTDFWPKRFLVMGLFN